jgi:hypothetical protein
METEPKKPIDRSARNAKYYAAKKEKQVKLIEAHAGEIAVLKLLNDDLILKLAKYENIPKTVEDFVCPKKPRKPKALKKV